MVRLCHRSTTYADQITVAPTSLSAIPLPPSRNPPDRSPSAPTFRALVRRGSLLSKPTEPLPPWGTPSAAFQRFLQHPLAPSRALCYQQMELRMRAVYRDLLAADAARLPRPLGAPAVLRALPALYRRAHPLPPPLAGAPQPPEETLLRAVHRAVVGADPDAAREREPVRRAQSARRDGRAEGGSRRSLQMPRLGTPRVARTQSMLETRPHDRRAPRRMESRLNCLHHGGSGECLEKAYSAE